jgi:hypothetical protein
MVAGERWRSRNRMFWRKDGLVAACFRDKRFVDFNRACGRDGLFFDDLDPINEDKKKKEDHADVTDKLRGGGYQCIAFRADRDPRGFFIQVFCGRGTGQGPIEATLAAYRDAIERGDPVTRGLESILLAEPSPQPTSEAAPLEDDFMELIG